MALVTPSSDEQFTSLQLGDSYGPAVFSSVLSSYRYQWIKRALDVTLALTLLVLLSWLLIGVGIAILLDSEGPVLFRQVRIGRNGRPFGMLKFRTMRAERRVRNTGPPAGVDERRQRHKSLRDPRVTRVGRYLRRACLDELPQLWNVVWGDMSVVGPRPELPSIVQNYEPWQHLRHRVSPGITGWWQVNREADQLMHEATELDIFYVEHCSLSLDLRILARTLGAVVDGRGAY